MCPADEDFPDCRACSAGRLDSARALVEGGKAKLESKDASGATPMGVSASCGDQTITLYLLSKGADPEVNPHSHFFATKPFCYKVHKFFETFELFIEFAKVYVLQCSSCSFGA